MMIICLLLGIAYSYKFAIFNDVHVDMAYMPANFNSKDDYPCQSKELYKTTANFGRKKCDPPLALLTSMLQHICNKASSLDVVITLGDYLSHDLPINNMDKKDIAFPKLKNAMNAVVYETAKYFPKTPIIFCVGNNDVLLHNSIPTGEFKNEYYSYLYQTWFKNVEANKAMDTSENRDSFMNGGYFYFDYAADVRIISINSLYYFNGYENLDTDTADKQIEWLKQQMIACSGKDRKAIIVMHIPTGPNIKGGVISYYWNKQYEEKFKAIIKTYEKSVSVILSGHTHFDDVRVNNAGAGKEYELRMASLFMNNVVLRAISPRSENNPGYAILDYIDGIPKTIKSYSFDVDSSISSTSDDYWSLFYTSSIELDLPDYMPISISDFLVRMSSNSTLYSYYDSIRKGFEYSLASLIR